METLATNELKNGLSIEIEEYQNNFLQTQLTFTCSKSTTETLKML